MTLEVALAAVLVAALAIYAVTGGADYGGGVWDLLASGPRADTQREWIAHAIGPIWEANHVWLILAVVVLFTAFPPAFAEIGRALHLPLTALLLGIVSRGSAFAFRSFHGADEPARLRWGRVFAVASAVTPILLGVTLAAVASGRVPAAPESFVHGFVTPWLTGFGFAVGGWTLALFAYLAAVYLTLEGDEPAVREDFRRRALIAWGVVAVGAALVLVWARGGAPVVYRGLTASAAGVALVVATAACAAGAGFALWRRSFGVARVLAAAQTALVIVGWGAAQFPYLVVPHLTLSSAAAPAATLRMLAWALAVGALLLFPSFFYLFRIFKSER